MVLVSAFFLGWCESRRNKLKKTIERTESLGGHVLLDTAMEEDGTQRVPLEGDFFDIHAPQYYFWLSFRKARAIVFRGTAVCDTDLEFLSSVDGLTHIDLFETSVTNGCLAILNRCDRLELVTLSPGQISEAEIEAFLHENPNCSVEIEGLELWRLTKLIEEVLENELERTLTRELPITQPPASKTTNRSREAPAFGP